MKKIIYILTIAITLSLSVNSLSGFTQDNFKDDFTAKSLLTNKSNYEWKEYILVGDQWYLIIHYDDGLIGVFPVAQPTED